MDDAVEMGHLSRIHQNNYFVYEIGQTLRDRRGKVDMKNDHEVEVQFYLMRSRNVCIDCVLLEKRIAHTAEMKRIILQWDIN